MKGVFGIPLLHSIQYAYTTITFIDEEIGSPCVAVIPTIIAKCGSYLKENGKKNTYKSMLSIFLYIFLSNYLLFLICVCAFVCIAISFFVK